MTAALPISPAAWEAIRGGAADAPADPDQHPEAHWLRRGDYLPSSVRACVNSGVRAPKWRLALWDRLSGEAEDRPYVCLHWRCPGKCAHHANAVLYSRMKEALEGIPHHEVVYMVLTFDRHGTLDGAGWRDADTAYRAKGRCLQRLRQRIARRYGLRYREVRVIWTLEQHRDGWPHLNVLLHCPRLAREVDLMVGGAMARGEARPTDVSGWLAEAVVGARFGRVSTAEVARDRNALASYLVKASSEGRISGELAKLSQAPRRAPKGTRRYGASQGFLPPLRTKSGKYTGIMLTPGKSLDAPPDYDRLGPAPPGVGAASEVVAEWRGRDDVRLLPQGDDVAVVDRETGEVVEVYLGAARVVDPRVGRWRGVGDPVVTPSEAQVIREEIATERWMAQRRQAAPREVPPVESAQCVGPSGSDTS